MCPVVDVQNENKVYQFLEECGEECTDLAIRKFCGPETTFNDAWQAIYKLIGTDIPYSEFLANVYKYGNITYTNDKDIEVAIKVAQENPKSSVDSQSINDWCKTVYRCSKEHGWWENFNFPEKLALIHSEISETLEEYRNQRPYTEIRYETDKDGAPKPEGIPVEIADAVIRIMDLCGYLGIDLEEAIAIKHKYNLTRPYKHGRKIC